MPILIAKPGAKPSPCSTKHADSSMPELISKSPVCHFAEQGGQTALSYANDQALSTTTGFGRRGPRDRLRRNPLGLSPVDATAG